MNKITGITRDKDVTTTVYSDGQESVVSHASEAAAVEYEQSMIALSEVEV
jgi:hypothetical protein